MNMRTAVVCLFLLCLLKTGTANVNSSASGISGILTKLFPDAPAFMGSIIGVPAEPNTNFFLKRGIEEDDGCLLVLENPVSLDACEFNASAKTFFIIHGWSMSGVLEPWVPKLAVALYNIDRSANVVVVEWLGRARLHYPLAVQNTRVVGKDIAAFVDWLHKQTNVSLEKIHFLGYSLGAHVAGFAGSFITSPGKIGRITGLDPAGPAFEGMLDDERLSPNDAHFVDAVHTFTRGTLGLSIGIQQPVAHADFYPNGGHFQPGCVFTNAYKNIADMGFMGIVETVKCEHERSIHLFIDSLLHPDQQSMAYRCTDMGRFERGMCLSCGGHRCNRMGYGVERVRPRRSHRLFLRTSAAMPFKVYHYQLKVHLMGLTEKVEEFLEPALSVSLFGTKGEANDLKMSTVEKVSPNRTYSFLVTTDVEVGDLLQIRIRWDKTSTWGSVWHQMKVLLPWAQGKGNYGNQLLLRKIRVKSGESQQRLAFCSSDFNKVELSPELEQTFQRCREEWDRPRRRHARSV
ncbi:hepatic triacylglycerol lipase-like [Lampetra fluviatilis]